ncbi:MAG TPA: TonB-dependent receptor [Chitinophagaceae bacterium]|nr:TonB-dependent receptor [Chitinophagaceae bacterium]
MKLKVCLSLLCIWICVVAVAQTRQVSGRVMKENGTEAISLATVRIKGGTAVTTTDTSGRFVISVPNNNTVLVFSSVGFSNTEFAVKDLTVVDVFMPQVSSTLEDVVVVGYGTAKKKDLTGAIASLPGSTLEKIPVSSVAEALTGRLAGVQVTTTDGAPGAEIVIRVRGGGSVTQDNSPLYIVDGFPVNSINDIAPTDILSIDILKDAATSAIYGARGANGVVQITTKSARGGKTTISLNSFVQARTLPRKLEVLSPYEFALAQYEYARIRSQAEVDAFSKYFGVYEDLELYKNQKGTDWQKELFGNPALSQQHNLSITGGTEKTRMSFSISNNKDKGIMPGSAYQRTYLNFKLNQELYRTLKLDLTSRFTNTNVDGAGTSGGSSVRIGDGITTRPLNGLADFIDFDPLAGGANDDDYEQFIKSLVGPTALAAQDYRKAITKAFNMNAAVNWSILNSLIFRSEFGLELSWGNNKRYYGPLTGESRINGNSLPVGEIRNNRAERYRWANTLTYTIKKGGHDLRLLAGQEVIKGKLNNDFIRSENFDANLTPERIFANMPLGIVDQYNNYEGPADNLASFFGQANYQLNNKYLLTLTARYDGSLKFAPGKQWGLFPAAAAAWRLSQEDFMQDINAVSDLKLRVSYGASGNNRIATDLFRRTFSINTTRPIGFGDVNQPYWAAASTILVNPDLQWETTVTRNLGLDFGLFNNRLSGTVDLYHNTTKDLLVESDIPSYLGYTKQMRNIGQTANRGVELALNASVFNKKDFQISANFNIGFNKSKIEKLDGVDIKGFNSNWAGTDLKSTDDYQLRVGETVGLMYGYVTDGFYSVDDFQSFTAPNTYTLKPGITNIQSFLGGISLRPGLLKLRDLNGDSLITAEDRQVIGSAQPKFQGGFGINSTYRNFDFAAFFNYTYGNDVYNSGRIQFNMLYRTSYGSMLNTMNSANRFKYIDEAGKQVTSLEDLRKLNANATIWSPFSMGTATPVFHSYAVEDGSFLRLNNVTLGYSLPKNLISKIGMSKLRLYATVYNAFLWTNYSGYDPEVSATRNSSYTALTPGVDFSGYPKSRTYTAGINVTF